MYHNKWALTILINRLVSLCTDYGYPIILSIIFARHSMIMVMCLWLAKTVGDLLSFFIDRTTFMSKTQPKYILVGCELLIGIYLLNMHPTVFILIILIELINTLFSSNLSSIIPTIIANKDLTKFNSLYTAIGSTSYFISPMIVGFVVMAEQSLIIFIVYALITMLSALLLLLLPKIKLDVSSDITLASLSFKGVRDNFISVFTKTTVLKYFIIISMLSGIMGTIFDSYEAVFLTQSLKISESHFSFALSYLSCVFLLASMIYYKLGGQDNNMKHFAVSSVMYGGYLLIFSLSTNIIHILIAYTLLGLGQTFMGIFLGSYIQLNLERLEIKQHYIYRDIISSMTSCLVIVTIVLSHINATSLNIVYLILTTIYFITLIITYLLYTRKINLNRE